MGEKIHFVKELNKGRDPIVPGISEFTFEMFTDPNDKISRKLKEDDAVIVDKNLILGLKELIDLINKDRGRRLNGKSYSIRIMKGYVKEPLSTNNYENTHNLGEAADINVSGISVNELAAYAAEIEVFKNAGIGRIPRSHIVHLDVSEQLKPSRRWYE